MVSEARIVNTERLNHESPFLFTSTAPTEISTLSLHDALPICDARALRDERAGDRGRLSACDEGRAPRDRRMRIDARGDRKSTRLNSSHMSISYAVFCLKKKKIISSHYTNPDTINSAIVFGQHL